MTLSSRGQPWPTGRTAGACYEQARYRVRIIQGICDLPPAIADRIQVVLLGRFLERWGTCS